MPMQEFEKAAKPQSGLRKAEKAEEKKTKKARQRAARAQAAAQTVQVQPLRLAMHVVCSGLMRRDDRSG